MRLWTMAKVIVFTGIMGVAVLGMACQNGSDERVAQLEAQVADLQQDNIRLGADMLDMLKIMEDMTGREALAQSRMDSFNKRLDDTAERSGEYGQIDGAREWPGRIQPYVEQ